MIEITNEDVHKIIDDAMKNKDRYVYIFVSNNTTSISVNPLTDDDGMKWIYHEDVDSYGRLKYECSKCGTLTSFPSHYCPECGEERTGIINKEKSNENV